MQGDGRGCSDAIDLDGVDPQTMRGPAGSETAPAVHHDKAVVTEAETDVENPDVAIFQPFGESRRFQVLFFRFPACADARMVMFPDLLVPERE